MRWVTIIASAMLATLTCAFNAAFALPPTLIAFAVGGCTLPTEVQASAVASYSSGTATITLTGVVVGHAIILKSFNQAPTSGLAAVTANDGNAYVSDVQATQVRAVGNQTLQVAILHLYNVAAGTHTITLSGPNFGYAVAEEVAGLSASSPVTSSAASAGSTNPAPGSATPATTCSYIGSVVSLDSSANPTTFGDPPSGYTNVGLQTNGAGSYPTGGLGQAGSADYLTTTSSAAQNPSYATFTAAGAWVAAQAIYQGTGGGSGPSPSLAIKWHPGQWMSSTIFTGQQNTDQDCSTAGCAQADKANEISAMRGGPSTCGSAHNQPCVQGWEGYYLWSSIETSQNVYDFSATTGSGLDADYKAVTGWVSGTTCGSATYSNPRRLGIYLQASYFFSTNVTINLGPTPAYILNSSTYGPLGPDGTHYGYFTVLGGAGNGSGQGSAIWRPVEMARFEALVAAVANHVLPDGCTVDQSPYVEYVKAPLETAVAPQTSSGADGNAADSTYQSSGSNSYLALLEQLAVAGVGDFPHTNFVVTNNYLDNQTNSNTLEQALAVSPINRAGAGGPDILGATSGQYSNGGVGYTWGQASFAGMVPPFASGDTGGTVLGHTIPYLGTVQNTETIAGFGTSTGYTPLDILNQANNLLATHVAWQYITYANSSTSSDCPSATVTSNCETANWFGACYNNSNPQSCWNGGGDTLPNGGGVLTVIVNNTLTNSACPSNYINGCNTHYRPQAIAPDLSLFKNLRRHGAANDERFMRLRAAV